MEDANHTPNATANDLFKAFVGNPSTRLGIDEMVSGFSRIVSILHGLRHAAEAADMVRTLLGNANTVMTFDEMIEGLRKVDVMLSDIEDPARLALPAPKSAPVAELPAVAEAVPPAPVPEPAPVPVTDARKGARGTSIRLRANPRAGQHLAAGIWPDAKEEQRAKFMKLIDRHLLYVNERGEPIPVKPADHLVADDGWRVIDPIDGHMYTMLKHHIRTDYDLSYEELLMMFKLTPEQLPKAGPKYSEAKSRQAKQHGLGKNKPPRIRGAAPEGTSDLFLPAAANAA